MSTKRCQWRSQYWIGQALARCVNHGQPE